MEKKKMMVIRRKFACCTRNREISIDFDEQERIVTYDGLETCIINNQSYEDESGTSGGDPCPTDSLDDDAYSSCSSSKDVSGSISSKWFSAKSDEQGTVDWELSGSPQHFYVKEKPAYTLQFSDVEAMKEKFTKLLLGEDITGGCKGIQTALALSKAITNLAATVFGELWKLEPLSEEKKNRWQKEMDWLLSPTNYMIELVPSKQSNSSGRMLEIMTPKTRSDIHMNLPALKKLDSMLTETLESMVNTEFWYTEVGSRAKGLNKSTRESKRWWLPSPQVPKRGLSGSERNKLIKRGTIVYQVFRAAKSINENVLLEMPVPAMIKDALTKSGKANLGEDLNRVLAANSSSFDEILRSVHLGTEHAALDVNNRLEAAIVAWKEKIAEVSSGKSPVRKSLSFIKNPQSEIERLGLLLDRAETLKKLVKDKHPNLPQSFLDATKVQYGQDIGHAILEAYSRVLANLAFSILSRMSEILQEDVLSNPNSPAPPNCFPGIVQGGRIISSCLRHSLVDRMNKADNKTGVDSDTTKNLNVQNQNAITVNQSR